MVFSSTIFIFLFLPVVLLLSFLSRKKFNNLVLLFASLFFYAWGETIYVLIMVVSIFINYFFGLLIERFRKDKVVKWLLFCAVTLNMGMLGWFKYANFCVYNINELLKTFGLSLGPVDSVHLPIGISFFTFQAVTYIVDIYRGQAKAQKNFINIALYISLFPQLIAGPIVRYRDISSEISCRSIRLDKFAEGVRRFIVGMGKKVIIANPMGEVTDQIMAIPAEGLTFSLAWLGAVCYSLQIYFDFSGYSDMAIGLGRMFGFTFPENFRYPYIARSIREFWTRWHISLSSWFKDYLYIPLGGNRVSPLRTYVNLYIVFFLCGLWHGASWNFVMWGMLHGGFLVLERIGLSKLLNLLPPPIQHAYALLVILIGWVFFRIDNFFDIVVYLKSMFGFAAGNGVEYHLALYLDKQKIAALIVGIFFCMPAANLYTAAKSRIFPLKNRAGAYAFQWCGMFIESLVLILIFFLSSILIASGTYNPFIYFRF